MKTIFLKSAIAFILVFAVGFNSLAKASNPKKSTEIKSYIKSKIEYPCVAKEKLIEGFVVIEFEVNPDGAINIKAINSNSQVLLDDVKNQISQLKWLNKTDVGKTYYYRITFELIKI